MSGVNMVRNNLHRMYFDEEECAVGIRALKNYRKEFDERRGVFKDKPLHDWSSHAADAMRYLCVSLRTNYERENRPAIAAGFDVL